MVNVNASTLVIGDNIGSIQLQDQYEGMTKYIFRKTKPIFGSSFNYV